MISGFCHKVAENCVLLGYNAGVVVRMKDYGCSLHNKSGVQFSNLNFLDRLLENTKM
jgi:hypothetical protein